MKLNHIPPQLKASFNAHLADERIRSVREGCIVALTLFATFGILDIWAIPSALHAAWIIRGIIVSMLLVLLVSTWYKFFLQYYAPLVMTIYLSMGLATVAMIYLAGINELARHHYYIVIILEVMALYTWSFLTIYQTAITGLFLVALYIAMAVGLQHMNNAQEWPILLSNCFFLLGANVIGIYSNIKRNNYLRESFLLQQNLLSKLQLSEGQKKQSDFQSEHDPLTGLPNRKYLIRELKDMLSSAAAMNTRVALLFIDLDGFKPINDVQGHATGDFVLSVIGQRLAHAVREDDVIARIGGDEFVVALESGMYHRDEASSVAENILASFEKPIRQPDIKSKLSASIGIAFFPDHAMDADELLVAADHQMYIAKRRGKGKISMAPELESAASPTNPEILSAPI